MLWNIPGQSGSAVLAVLPPGFLWSSSLAKHRELESPWIRVSTAQQQPKHLCYPHYSHTESSPATGKKIIPTDTTTGSFPTWMVLWFCDLPLAQFPQAPFSLTRTLPMMGHPQPLQISHSSIRESPECSVPGTGAALQDWDPSCSVPSSASSSAGGFSEEAFWGKSYFMQYFGKERKSLWRKWIFSCWTSHQEELLKCENNVQPEGNGMCWWYEMGFMVFQWEVSSHQENVLVRKGDKMLPYHQMWVTVGFMNTVRAVVVVTDDRKWLLWPCYFITSLFKVSVYHFFIILWVCSPKFPWGVIHGCFHSFSSQLRWLIKNRTTVLKVFHGSILPLNCSCLVSYPCYIYIFGPGRRCAATTSICERDVAREFSPDIEEK